jgi:phage baseplate assembly protein W
MFIFTINNNMEKFKGFSTVNRIRAPYSLRDEDLIKRDLLNEFYTKLGERVMRPNFGSIIWDLIMDPSTETLDERIKEDVRKIINRDPRVALENVAVYALDHTIRVEIVISIIPTESTDILYLEYERKITEGVE